MITVNLPRKSIRRHIIVLLRKHNRKSEVCLPLLLWCMYRLEGLVKPFSGRTLNVIRGILSIRLIKTSKHAKIENREQRIEFQPINV